MANLDLPQQTTEARDRLDRIDVDEYADDLAALLAAVRRERAAHQGRQADRLDMARRQGKARRCGYYEEAI